MAFSCVRNSSTILYGLRFCHLSKSIAGDLDGISFVRFNFAKRVIIKVFDKLRINSTDKTDQLLKIAEQVLRNSVRCAPLQFVIHASIE